MTHYEFDNLAYHKNRMRGLPESAIAAQLVSKTIGQIEPGFGRFFFTKCQFSYGDIVRYLLAQTGPADLVISTWAISEIDLDAIKAWIEQGAVRQIRFVLDSSFRRRYVLIYHLMVKAFGSECMRLTLNHAKICTIRNDNWNIAIRSSANMNTNPRCEQFDIDDDLGLCEHVETFVGEVWKTAPDHMAPQEMIRGGFKKLFAGVQSVRSVDSNDW